MGANTRTNAHTVAFRGRSLSAELHVLCLQRQRLIPPGAPCKSLTNQPGGWGAGVTPRFAGGAVAVGRVQVALNKYQTQKKLGLHLTNVDGKK